MMKLCGCLEDCFEVGDGWCYSGVRLCSHFRENLIKDEYVSYCDKDGKEVRRYSTTAEYEFLKEVNRE